MNKESGRCSKTCPTSGLGGSNACGEDDLCSYVPTHKSKSPRWSRKPIPLGMGGVTDLIKYLVDKDTERSLTNALVLKETYNFMSGWLWFLFIFAILISFFFSINDTMISSLLLLLLLSFYFANVLAVFLTYQLILDFVKGNIERRNL